MRPRDGRSPALDRRRPEPQPLLAGSRELDVHERFVGRNAEIRQPRDDWLDAKDNAVAVVQGLAGLGKTSLAAETIHLFHERFHDGVFCFQSKPHALPFYEFLRRLDQRLALSSRPYGQLCERNPGGAVFLPESPRLSGDERRDHLCNNVVAVYGHVSLLLVLDNFETHLKSNGRCADPDWDVLLGRLADGLRRSTTDARRLLWTLGLASEPQSDFMIGGVWEEGSDAPLAPLLAELTDAGLVTRDETSAYGVHELVRERVAAWVDAHPDDQGGRTDAEVWKAFGVRYGRLFKEIRASGQPGAQDVASEMGRRGISYLVRAKAFEDLGSFASGVVTGTRDPRLLRGVVAELVGVVEEVSAGRERWRVRTCVADALWRSGQPDAALAFYEAAAKEAEASEHWTDVGVICQNWANALGDVGQLDAAKASFLRSAEAEEKAGSPRVDVLGAELEAFRIDVKQGKAVDVLPEVESRVDEIRSWWRRHRDGEDVAEAPDPEFLGRALVSGLDIAQTACLALERWEDCLELLGETEEAKRPMGRGEQELARTRFNRYGPLLRLGRLDEAQRTLEGCLAVFRKFDDSVAEATALSALAVLWDKRGDRVQAVGLARQALAVRNRLPDLADRSISHTNLSNYLDRLGETEESARHFLAAMVYFVLINHQ